MERIEEEDMKERRQRGWIMVITKGGKDRGRGYEGEETERD